ncbi:putative tetrahydroberberine oxidase [Lupinus albus]|uniref:Putative tetrahydroberberine oxidase n=1 Tax=Lupinus albus TaxID=3870 RepID=A0A6A4NXY5_LUPAL|nr:putative tetrahydroberberine oxidase [Lupinus albus]
MILVYKHLTLLDKAFLMIKPFHHSRVRSGGHDYEGLSYICKVPFIMIDLINISSIEINVAEETYWVQTGATSGFIFFRHRAFFKSQKKI